MIGSGTVLDSARFVTELAKHLGISGETIQAYCFGEHGDSEVLAWSQANVGFTSLTKFAETIGKPITKEIQTEIDDNVRKAAYKIINGKKATYYGIAGAITKICQAIQMDSNVILPVSTHHDIVGNAKNICLLLPTIVNRMGARRAFIPDFTKDELEDFEKSAKVIEEKTLLLDSLIE